MTIIGDWAMTILLGSLSYLLVYHPNYTSSVVLCGMSAMMLPGVGPFFLSGPTENVGKFFGTVAGPSFGKILTTAKDHLLGTAASVEGLSQFVTENAENALNSSMDKFNFTTVSVIDIAKTSITEVSVELAEAEDVSKRLSNWLTGTVKEVFGVELWQTFQTNALASLSDEQTLDSAVGNMSAMAKNALDNETVKTNYIEAITESLTSVLSDTTFIDDMIGIVTSAAQGFRDALSVAGTSQTVDPVF